MNHNAEEIKTSAVVQCLFRLTAAPFLIKMGLGRPFRASPLFILLCPHPSHLHPHAEAPSFALSHGRSDTHRLAEETHRHSLQRHTHTATVAHTATGTNTQLNGGIQARTHTTTSLRTGAHGTVSHTHGPSQSLTHIKLQSVTNIVSHVH